MKANSFFSRILGLVILCLSATFATAQVQQINSTITNGEYETAGTSSAGNVTMVAYKMPTGQIRLSCYFVTTAGVIELKDNLDVSSATVANVIAMSNTRAVLALRKTDGKLQISSYDISATGVLTLKKTLTGPSIKSNKPGVARLSSSNFAVGMVLSDGTMRLTTYTVNAAGTITKKDDENGGTLETIDLATMSDGRFIAGVRLTNNQLKVICFDVNSNQVITRRGDHQIGGAVKKISMVRLANNIVATFFTNGDNKLGSHSFELTGSGNFVVKDTDLDIKKPGTTTVYKFKELDGQYIGSDKILVSGITMENQHIVLPFKVLSNTNLQVQGGSYTSSGQFTLTYSTVANGKFLSLSRQMNNKYKLATFSW